MLTVGATTLNKTRLDQSTKITGISSPRTQSMYAYPEEKKNKTVLFNNYQITPDYLVFLVNGLSVSVRADLSGAICETQRQRCLC